MNRDETVLPALLGEVVDGLLDGLGHGTHGDDDVLGVGGSVVCERTVLATGQFADLTHVAGHDVRNCVVEVVSGLYGLEVNVSVLGCTAGHRSVRVESPLTESPERLLADHFLELFLVKSLDLLDLV